ncbi:MAG: hypothetical protein HY914_13200 [Desulfomonile tiedjei]|nr:hypothetical protein [Desulfomonile tiedjei]
MKSKILVSIASLCLVLAFTFPATAADVAQGKCISYDKEKSILTIEEYGLDFSKDKYGNPTGKQTVYDLSGALIGIPPAPGDVVRIAYEEKGKDRMGIRIQNVSKQDLMKK